MKQQDNKELLDQWFRQEAKEIRIRPAKNSWRRIDKRLESKRRSRFGQSRQNLLFAAGFVLLLGMTFALGFHSGQQKSPSIRTFANSNFQVTDLVMDDYTLAYHDALQDWIQYANNNGWRAIVSEESENHLLPKIK